MENKDNISIIKRKSAARECIEAFSIALLLYLFISTFFVKAFKIPSGSMKATLLIGDHLLVNRMVYGVSIPLIDKYILHFKKPERGDIIVFKWPRDERKDFIKRVIGVEGDIIKIEDDVLYINDEKVKTEYFDDYNDDDIKDAVIYRETLSEKEHYILDHKKENENFGPVKVPLNSVFVMGDNRDNSLDSRYWGFVSNNKIKGKAFILYWSWPQWRRIFNIIK